MAVFRYDTEGRKVAEVVPSQNLLKLVKAANMTFTTRHIEEPEDQDAEKVPGK